jgi:DNA-binding transcriptional MerR regulator
MRIGELAAAAGISRDTLRFYEQQGLIRARRLENGYRDYPDEVLMLVNYIREAQQLGFTLAEIGRKLPEVWDAAEPGGAIAGA